MSRSRSSQYTANLSVDERQAGWLAPRLDSEPSDEVDSSGNLSGVIRFASLYPGSQVNPRYWNSPNRAGAELFAGQDLPKGYESTLRPGAGLSKGPSSLATRIRIPDIGLDEAVEELDLVVTDEDVRYEQPINVVGHIRNTANPGENGKGWYFGHQSNFGSGEGAVFQRLPDVFDLFRKDPIFVYIDTDSASFAYRVIGTDVEDREDLKLTQSDPSTITLVTSWPPLVFDQRFLVFAELVGISRHQ